MRSLSGRRGFEFNALLNRATGEVQQPVWCLVAVAPRHPVPDVSAQVALQRCPILPHRDHECNMVGLTLPRWCDGFANLPWRVDPNRGGQRW